jgi:GT2 family glycosyltransferase
MNETGTPMTNLDTTVAVVVHHRSYDTVANTVEQLIGQGIERGNILVVDNSEQPHFRSKLQSSMPDGVRLDFVPNNGYAAAVNFGMDHFHQARTPAPEFFIVATHETEMRPMAVRRLVEALLNDAQAAVAGPTLISGAPGAEIIWSQGGYLSTLTHFPNHFGHREPHTPRNNDLDPPQVRSWLDGAFLVYRWRDVIDERLSEDFFLYMEETDLHLRLGRQGKRVLWVPGSTVWQSSGGIPAYYLARNLRLLFLRNEPRWRRAFVPLGIAKRLAADLVRRRSLRAMVPSLRGLFARLNKTPASVQSPFVAIVNPLGGALAHYQHELTDNLRAAGIGFELHTTLEPSIGAKSRLRWLLDYRSIVAEAARGARSSENGRLLVLWPVLGYLDVVLLALFGVRTSLIMHDPRPLVRAIGYGKLARVLARVVSRRIELVVHSEQAAVVVREDAPTIRLTTLAHPILTPEKKQSDTGGLPIVQVFGQFKPDRDLGALEAIAKELRGKAHFKIDGRRWPQVAGWEVSDRFVPESEVDGIISRSAVVVIPYRLFFQSNVAIRSLELGVPFVGPRKSSLADLIGSDSSWLAASDVAQSWSRAVESAVESTGDESSAAGIAWRNHAIENWRSWSEA